MGRPFFRPKIFFRHGTLPDFFSDSGYEKGIQFKRNKKGCFFSLLLSLVLLSGFIHFRGATSPHTIAWNLYPVNIDKDPSRIWDWNDLQFLRGITPEK